MKFSFSKTLFILTIISIFFWNTGITAGNIVIPYSIPFVYLCLFLVGFFGKENNYKKINLLIRKTPLKYLLLFILWAIVSSLFLRNSHNTALIIFRVIRDYFLFVLPIVLLPCLIVPKYISYRKLTKLILCICLVIFLYGFFDFILQYQNPSLHLKLFSTVCSAVGNYSKILYRARGIFFEPTFYATFIFAILPLLYTLYDNGYNITGHSAKNKYIYLLLITLAWISLILTKSPMYIAASLIYLLIYYRRKKFIIYILILALTFFALFMITQKPVEKNKKTAVSRIVKTAESLNSMEELILNEGSLATRICLVYITLSVSKEHPIIGVGYANSKQYIYNQVIKSDIPLTDEIIKNNFKNEGLTISSVFFQVLCWTGIIGVSLLYMFFIKVILLLNKIKKYTADKDTKILLQGYISVMINFIICSVYWELINDTVMWLIIGILLSFMIPFIKHNYTAYKGGIG